MVGNAMAREKRKRLSAPRVANSNHSPQVHDRRATDLLINAVVAPIEVDDPLGLNPGDKIVVMRSLRDDPLGAMHQRSQIEKYQYDAGRHWQKAREISELGGGRGRLIQPGKP